MCHSTPREGKGRAVLQAGRSLYFKSFIKFFRKMQKILELFSLAIFLNLFLCIISESFITSQLLFISENSIPQTSPKSKKPGPFWNKKFFNIFVVPKKDLEFLSLHSNMHISNDYCLPPVMLCKVF